MRFSTTTLALIATILAANSNIAAAITLRERVNALAELELKTQPAAHIKNTGALDGEINIDLDVEADSATDSCLEAAMVTNTPFCGDMALGTADAAV